MPTKFKPKQRKLENKNHSVIIPQASAQVPEAPLLSILPPTPQNITNATLSWTKPEENGSTISAFVITELSPNTTEYTLPPTTFQQVVTIIPGEHYSFNVHAISNLGKSLFSKPVIYDAPPLVVPDELQSSAKTPTDIMISVYCGPLLPYAKALKAVLIANGYSVFLCDQIKAGEDFRDEISLHAALCQVFIPFVDLPWCNSRECGFEFKIALHTKLTKGTPILLPILLENFKEYEQFPTLQGALCSTAGLAAKSTELNSKLWGEIISTLKSHRISHRVSPPAESAPEKTAPQSALFVSVEIPYEEITEPIFLAAGGYGRVYSAKYKGEEVAVKMLNSNSLPSEELGRFKLEVQMMNSVRSKFVVNLYGACTKEPNLALVMELMEGGSLGELLRAPHIELPWKTRLVMLEEIAMGVKVLHNNKPTILHRDLKSANILLDDRHHCKLADFGFALVKEDSLTKTSLVAMGTLAWMAPELLSLRPKYSKKTDIYAFGIIMWEISTRRLPYKDVHPDVLRSCIQEGEREEVEEGNPPGYAELMMQCWHQQPSVRPLIDEIIDRIGQIKRNYAVIANSIPTIPPAIINEIHTPHVPSSTVSMGDSRVKLQSKSDEIIALRQLPLVPEIWLTIISMADLKTLCTLSRVCVAFYSPCKRTIGGTVSTFARLPLTDRGSIAVDEKNGFLYAATAQFGKIFKISLEGKVSVMKSLPVGIFGIAVDKSGVILAALEEAIVRISPKGQVSVYAGLMPGAKVELPQFANSSKFSGVGCGLDGAVYILERCRIQKITSTGVASTLAGTGESGFLDGPAELAKFESLRGIVVSKDDVVYVSDGNRIRKIANGIVSTYAGTSKDGNLDGPATKAQFSSLRELAIDHEDGSIYTTDCSRTIRKISVNGHVTTVAGKSTDGLSHPVLVDGPARKSTFSFPESIAIYKGFAYIYDEGRIRKLSLL